MSEAELQLHRARRIGERGGWLTTFLYKNESGMYIVYKKKKKKKKWFTKKQKTKKNGLQKKIMKTQKKMVMYIYLYGKKGQSHWGRNRYRVQCKGNCSTVE